MRSLFKKILLLLIAFFTVSSSYSQSKNSLLKKAEIDSIVINHENRIEKVTNQKLKFAIDSINFHSNKMKSKLQKEISDSNNSILTTTSWIIGVFSLAFTLIFALSIINIYNKNKEIKSEVENFKLRITEEEKNYKSKLKNKLKHQEEVNRLLEQLNKSTIDNDKNISLLNEERIAFLEFHEDLLQFLEVFTTNYAISNNKHTLIEEFNSKLYEHGSIMNLYSNDEDQIIKTCQFLKEKGTNKSLKHLEYIVNNYNEESDIYKSIDLAICGVKYREKTA